MQIKVAILAVFLLFCRGLQGQSFATGTNPQLAVIQEDHLGKFVVGGTLSATLTRGWNPSGYAKLVISLSSTTTKFFTDGQTAEAHRGALKLPVQAFPDRLEVDLPIPYGLEAWQAGSTITVKNFGLIADGGSLKDGDVVFVTLSTVGQGDDLNLTFSGASLALLKIQGTPKRRTDAETAH